MTVFATLLGNAAFAQNKTNNAGRSMGGASQNASSTSTGMAWGIGLGGLAVIGAVVGATAAAASNSTTGGTFTH